MNSDRVICDNCEHYYSHPSGTTSRCWEALTNPHSLSIGYFRDREDGNKTTCKAFKKIYSEVEGVSND